MVKKVERTEAIKAMNWKKKQKQRALITEDMKHNEQKQEQEQGSLRRLKMTDEHKKRNEKETSAGGGNSPRLGERRNVIGLNSGGLKIKKQGL